MNDPVTGLGPITVNLAQDYHHLVLRQEPGERGKPGIASITYWKDEGERPTEREGGLQQSLTVQLSQKTTKSRWHKRENQV